MNREQNNTGISIVAWKENREILTLWEKNTQRIGNIVVAKSEGIRKALIKAKQEGWNKIELQSSSG